MAGAIERGRRLAPLHAFDAAALARAEAAVLALSDHFERWLRDEIEGLRRAVDLLDQEPQSQERRERVYIAAHNLKGIGGAYNHPLVSRLAASLCTLMESPGEPTPLHVIDAHADAIARVGAGPGVAAEDPMAFPGPLADLERRVPEDPGRA